MSDQELIVKAKGGKRLDLLVALVVAFFAQNAIALPYVAKNGPGSAKDFFVGDIWKSTPGRFAMVDLLLVVWGFHAWALVDARRHGIFGWWVASFVLTFTVGIGTAIPFYAFARESLVK
ncbi:MAG: DUF2834 domain-containing protein [Segniliparus sp.]|uniref:DUF2834 domain-containing protein n=1 Tax=Segniliparus sp. TaxID=2804064 RepID=UPI003F3E6CD8